jgi:hypothetical protein
MALTLSQLINVKKQDEGEWFRYGDTSFEVKLAFYGRKAMQEIYDASRVRKPDPRNPRNFIEETDNDLFRQNYVPRVIKGWKGLTLKALAQLVVMEVEGVDETAEVPYSNEEAMALIAASIPFDQWVTAMCSDVATYNQAKKEAALKNSLTAHDTNSKTDQDDARVA